MDSWRNKGFRWNTSDRKSGQMFCDATETRQVQGFREECLFMVETSFSEVIVKAKDTTTNSY